MKHPRHRAWLAMMLIASSGCVSRCGESSRATGAVPWNQIRSAEARQRGRQLYVRYCVLCHGEHADGRGVRSLGLDRRPADFTTPQWSGTDAPARAYRAIREGVSGTPMASWSALSEAESWDLVAYLVSVSKQGP
jgi:mono/diheme cytochrome c family protein